MAKATKKKPVLVVPDPVKFDSRNCFGICFYKTATEADDAAVIVRKLGLTYNGGFFHGMPCGRATTWDYTDETLGPLFAVTV
jgi:hypothetical protein